MGWITFCGEVMGTATVSFIRTTAKLERQEIFEVNDFCPEETK